MRFPVWKYLPVGSVLLLVTLGMMLRPPVQEEPQKTGWPLTPEEERYILTPEYQRRPGSEQNRHLPALWPVTPSAGYWTGRAWLDTHARLVETVRANRGPVDILLVGDSITQQWGSPLDGKPLNAAWQQHFGPYKTVNIGIGGDKTQNVLWRLDHGGVDGLQPRIVILLIGNNNMFFTPETGVDAAAQGVRACVARLRAKFPGAHVVAVKIFPAGLPGSPFYEDIKKTNAALDRLMLEADPQVHVLDLWSGMVNPDGTVKSDLFLPDKTHLTQEAGYTFYAEKLRPLVEKLLQAKAALFPHAPTEAGWVTIWDADWRLPAGDAGPRADNGSRMWLAEPARNGNYAFSRLSETPWGPNRYVHTIRLPEGMPGGYTRQVVWPVDEGKGRGPLSWDRALAPRGDLYLGFFIRFRGSQGRPYRLDNLGGQKMLYAVPAPETGKGRFAHIFIRKGGTPVEGGWAGFEPQPSPDTGCESASYYAERGTPVGRDGRWNLLEYVIHANTRTRDGCRLDGLVEIYVDGVLQHRETRAFVYAPGQDAATMNSLSLNPIYGGGTKPVPYDLFVDYGRMKVMAR